MMINLNIIKEILLILENKPENLDTVDQIQSQYLSEYSVEDVRKACKFLIDEQLMNGKVIYADGAIYTITIGSLTSLGINYLIRLKDKKVWKRVEKLSKNETITMLRLMEIVIKNNEKNPISNTLKYILIPIFVAVISGLIIYFLTK